MFSPTRSNQICFFFPLTIRLKTESNLHHIIKDLQGEKNQICFSPSVRRIKHLFLCLKTFTSVSLFFSALSHVCLSLCLHFTDFLAALRGKTNSTHDAAQKCLKFISSKSRAFNNTTVTPDRSSKDTPSSSPSPGGQRSCQLECEEENTVSCTEWKIINSVVVWWSRATVTALSFL